MANETKMQILSVMVKQGTQPYRAATVFNETGLPRQLIAYHLDSMLSTGWVEKHGVHYLNVDMDSLIEALSSRGDSGKKRPWATKFLAGNGLKNFNKLIDEVRWGLAVKFVDSERMRKEVLAEIDETIRVYKAARKLLVDPIAPKTARLKIRSQQYDEFVEDVQNNWKLFLGSAKNTTLETQIASMWEDTDE